MTRLKILKMSQAKGFTIIEFLLYLGLLAIIMGGMLVATYQIVEVTSKNQARVVVQEEVNFLMSKIAWGLNGASLVSAGSTSLTITRPDLGADSPLVFSYDAGANNLSLSRGASAAVVLNSSYVTVEPGGSQIFNYDPAIAKVDISLMVDNLSFVQTRYLR